MLLPVACNQENSALGRIDSSLRRVTDDRADDRVIGGVGVSNING
jgi:hypothetical protein